MNVVVNQHFVYKFDTKTSLEYFKQTNIEKYYR